MNKTWRLRSFDLDLSENLVKGLALSPRAAQVLANRGIKTLEEGERFIRPSLSHIRSPTRMANMENAVSRIIQALENREEVLIYGDYDVDGITSAALLVVFFRELGMKPRYYIPHRLTEGYGLNIDAVKRFSVEGVNLLITSDCGVSNYEEILEAGRLGIDTLVVDHHEPPDELPPARAVLNPKRRDCPFPFEGLSGVGVAFQLLIALRAKLRERGFWHGCNPPNLRRYLDLVCLGTVSDLVPLLDENRILVKFGLEELTDGERKGIKALKTISGLEGKAINTGHVAFQLAPRLNACGRLGHAARAVELLLTDNAKEAEKIASELEQLNSQRQTLEDQIFSEIFREVEQHPEFLRDTCLFFSSRDWHPGVIGIAASRLVERFRMPSVLIALSEENLGKGSARATGWLDLYQTLKQCQDLLVGFGGHRAAAGFTVRSDLIGVFRQAFEKAASQELTDEVKAPRLYIDAEVKLEEIDYRLVEELMLFEPYGMGNPKPLFLTRNVAVWERRIVGGDSLKLKIGDRKIFDAIGFRMGDRLPLLSDPIDLVFTPQLNHWLGSRKIELEMKDLTPHAVRQDLASAQ